MGGGGSSSNPPVEAPNSLISDSLLKITDLLCEGPILGFAQNSGAYGLDPLTSTYFNNVVVRNLDGSYNFNVSGQGFEFAWTLGYPNQGPLSGFEHITCQVPLPPDTRLSNPANNAGLPKQLIVTFNTNQYPDANTMLIAFRIPAMYTSDSAGNINGFEIDTQVDISVNNGPFTTIGTGLQFIGKNTSPYFRTYQYTLPTTTPLLPFYQWTVKIYKTSTDVMSAMTANDIYVDSVALVSASQYSYPNSALAGLYIDGLQFGIVPARAYLIQGLLVNVPSGYTPTQYNVPVTFTRQCDVESGNNNVGVSPQAPSSLAGLFTGMGVSGVGLQPNTVIQSITNGPAYFFSVQPTPTGGAGVPGETVYFNSGNAPIVAAQYPDVWNGTFTSGIWTDNPAWIFYDFVTNPRYGLGQYINTANIDIWTLYQVSQYCDQLVDAGLGNGTLEPQFTCNAFIREPEDAYNMLLNLASAFRGMLYYGNGTIRANITDNKYPVFNYTNANVIGGAFNYSSTARSARHNAIQVRYTDTANLYRDNYILIEDNQGIIQYGYNKKEIAAFGCTSIGQATRVANWILATERLRTETVSFQVGFDGLYMRPGDVFNLYDNFRMNRSQGGRVMSFDTGQKFITLDRPVNLDSGVIYALSCVVPAANLDATGDVTGSNQIPLIRNPQIQTCVVLNANISGLSTLQVSGGFSGLMNNSVWILSATGVYTSGYIPTVFEQAPQYECLTITQSAPGILDVLAINYNTGINYTINTGFSTIMNPIPSGNLAAPLPVTNLTGYLVTGTFSNNAFYEYFNLTWSASTSSTVSTYVISGDVGSPGVYSQIGTTTSTGFTYVSEASGMASFNVCAVGKGGGISAPASFSFIFPGVSQLDQSQIRFWVLPAGFGDLEQIAVFYNRPGSSTTDTAIYYSTGASAPFKIVLDQDFYPVLGNNISGLSTSGTTAYFQTTSYDIPTTLISQGAIQQANNTLLYLVDNELMSVGQITGMGNNVYAFSMSRGVLETFASAHTSNTSGWMFLSADINSFSDQSIVSVFNATGYDTGVATRYFQIQNRTAVLDGPIVPPAPGIAYLIPNPSPGAPTSLTATVGTGKIVRLNWTAPSNTDIIEYRVYRATAPFTTFAQIATETSSTYYDDIDVILGVTYEYYVTAVAQNEQESTQSNTVTAVPQFIVPSGINTNVPANAGAISINSSGTYLAADGTLLAQLTFNVPALPSGAAYQNLYYVKNGGNLSGAMVGAQVSNAQATTATIEDLTPNTLYTIGSQAISNFGLFSNIITAGTNSPYLAPAFPAVAGGAGSAPNAPSGFMASGGLGGTANFIALNWLSNVELNLEEYAVYRNVINSIPANPMANVGSNGYIDATVTGGINYFYWVSAINRSEVSSALTGPVQASTENAPSIPTPPQPSSSGFYLSSDGNVFSDFTFNILKMPSGAIGQQMFYRLHGASNWVVANDISNTVDTLATINDLTPSQLYDFGLSAYSINGVSTSVVTMTGIPFQAPSKNTPPSAPTGVTTAVPQFGQIPPYYNGQSPSLMFPATTVSWSGVHDTDIAYYEIVWPDQFENARPPDSPVPLAVYQNSVGGTTTAPNETGNIALYPFAFNHQAFFIWVRSVDRNGNASAWAFNDGGNTAPNSSFTYAGDLGAQNYNGAQISQVQINSVTNSSAVKIINLSPQYGLITVSGASNAGSYPNSSNAPAYFNVSAFGFSVAPEACSVTLDGGVHSVNYRQTLSTSTLAAFTVYNNDGGANISSGQQFGASMSFSAYM